MNSIKQALWLFFILFLLGGAGWYYINNADQIYSMQQVPTSSPDFIIHRLNLLHYNKEGALVVHLNTPLLQHLSEEKAELIHSPYILYQEAAHLLWEIRAHYAKAIDAQHNITFFNQVKINQYDANKKFKSSILTEKITYYPKTKYAATDQEIKWIQSGSSILSKGLEADLAEQKIKLLNKAHIIYEPQKT